MQVEFSELMEAGEEEIAAGGDAERHGLDDTAVEAVREGPEELDKVASIVAKLVVPMFEHELVRLDGALPCDEMLTMGLDDLRGRRVGRSAGEGDLEISDLFDGLGLHGEGVLEGEYVVEVDRTTAEDVLPLRVGERWAKRVVEEGGLGNSKFARDILEDVESLADRLADRLRVAALSLGPW